jgi:plasmid stabilization system protein ParE
MPKALRILTEAESEAREAYQWYRERSERAAARFQGEFERAIEEIQEHPQRWPEYLHGTRFRRLRRFPYLVVYRDLEDEIQVIAVSHGHRREGYWRRRQS